MVEIKLEFEKYIYGFISDIADYNQKTIERWIYGQILNFVNDKIAMYNSLFVNKELKLDNNIIKFEVKLDELNDINIGITDYKQENSNMKYINLIIGPKLYDKLLNIVKLTKIINDKTNVDNKWQNLNEFISIVIINSVIVELIKMDKEELNNEMENILKDSGDSKK
jgi:hypothetical protein